jgi:hypothetical protein
MDKKSSLAATLILLIGVSIRCTHLFLIDLTHEPFRLGGLFIAFANEIAAHNFRFPVNIPYYSAGGIPFAYPPLGFYVEAILLKLFPRQIFTIANLLPPLVSILALGLAARFFYQWAGGWNLRSLSALAGYALIPNAFYNQIEAAGLAEAFGSLALVIYFDLLSAYQATHTFKAAFYAGLGLALCVLSAPGSALGAVLISLVFALDTLLSAHWTEGAQPYLQLSYIGITGLALSAPYWLPVIINHGMGIFLTPIGMQYEMSGQTTFLRRVRANWFTYSAIQLDGIYFWSIAILLGSGWLAWKRKLFLPLAFLVLFSIPRENAWVTAFPAALLISHGIADVLIPTIKSLHVSTLLLRARIMWVVLGLILYSMVTYAFDLIGSQVQNEYWKIKPVQIEAFRTAREIVPPVGQVIVIGNPGLREWSPYLLRREVLNTEFGLEWQPHEYRQIFSANQALDSAENWQDVVEAVRLLTNQKQIYVILDPTDAPTALDITNGNRFLIKMNTPELQVGILEVP